MNRAKIVLSLVTILCGFGGLIFCGVGATTRAQTTGVTIELEPVATGLNSPLFVTSAHDGTNRLFIVEQAGRIKLMADGSNTPRDFLDITSRVLSGGERGLLGLTFHPQFETNRRFFVNYTRRNDGATVIAEYRASASNPDVADTSETVLLTIAQPFSNHNGGMIEFGPDGLLYIGMGDGGSANDPGNRAQNVNELLGKMLRIDVNSSGALPYGVPSSNPFFGPTPGRDEIYAIGLRNPFRFSFDRATGQLLAGDVGQGQREEVDIITLGGNYGWRVFEGTRCTGNDPQLCGAISTVAPIAEYTHSNGRCSITGGYVYRGSKSSLPLGSYVYGDFCTGEIFLLNNGAQALILDTNLAISSFGEDEAGEIYVADLSGGAVYRIVNPDAEDQVTARIDSVTVRRRSTGAELLPVTVKNNGKKYEIIVRGEGFAPGAVVFVGGRGMNTRQGEIAGAVLIARLRKGTIAEPGPLAVEVINPDNTRSNQVTLLVVE